MLLIAAYSVSLSSKRAGRASSPGPRPLAVSAKAALAMLGAGERDAFIVLLTLIGSVRPTLVPWVTNELHVRLDRREHLWNTRAFFRTGSSCSKTVERRSSMNLMFPLNADWPLGTRVSTICA